MQMPKHSTWDLYVEGLKINWFFIFSQSDIEAFIRLSKDDSPIHTNFDLVKKLNFKSPLLHGALLATQLSRLIGKELPDSNAMTIGFSIDFVNPAYIDEELLFDSDLLHKSESTKILDFKFKILRSKTIIARGKISAKWLDLIES
jgi:3-oxoacyl-[acyl-carrier protein] reductase